MSYHKVTLTIVCIAEDRETAHAFAGVMRDQAQELVQHAGAAGGCYATCENVPSVDAGLAEIRETYKRARAVPSADPNAN